LTTTPIPWLESLLLGLAIAVLAGMLSQGLLGLAEQSSLGAILVFDDTTPISATYEGQPILVRPVGASAGATCALDVTMMRTEHGSLFVVAVEPDRAVQAIWRGGRTAAARSCPAGTPLSLEATALPELRAATLRLEAFAGLLIPVIGGW
jgi:hypothetical protein